jgi:hypothetical protein
MSSDDPTPAEEPIDTSLENLELVPVIWVEGSPLTHPPGRLLSEAPSGYLQGLSLAEIRRKVDAFGRLKEGLTIGGSVLKVGLTRTVEGASTLTIDVLARLCQ